MTKTEIAQLLTIVAGFDHFIVPSEVNVEAWHLALGHVDYQLAQRAVIAHYASPEGRKSITVADILIALQGEERGAMAQIEADVRSAKARGIVPKDWPARLKLEPHHATRLATAREQDRVTAMGYQAVEA